MLSPGLLVIAMNHSTECDLLLYPTNIISKCVQTHVAQHLVKACEFNRCRGDTQPPQWSHNCRIGRFPTFARFFHLAKVLYCCVVFSLLMLVTPVLVQGDASYGADMRCQNCALTASFSSYEHSTLSTSCGTINSFRCT